MPCRESYSICKSLDMGPINDWRACLFIKCARWICECLYFTCVPNACLVATVRPGYDSSFEKRMFLESDYRCNKARCSAKEGIPENGRRNSHCKEGALISMQGCQSQLTLWYEVWCIGHFELKRRQTVLQGPESTFSSQACNSIASRQHSYQCNASTLETGLPVFCYHQQLGLRPACTAASTPGLCITLAICVEAAPKAGRHDSL